MNKRYYLIMRLWCYDSQSSGGWNMIFMDVLYPTHATQFSVESALFITAEEVGQLMGGN